MKRRKSALLATILLSGIAACWPPAAPAQSTRNLLMNCNSCHSLHGGGGFLVDPTKADLETLCLSCHGPGNPLGLTEKTVHTNNAQTLSVTCRVCHNPHYNYYNGRDQNSTDTWYTNPANPNFWLNKKLIGTRLSKSGPNGEAIETDSVTNQLLHPGVAVFAPPPQNHNWVSDTTGYWFPTGPRQVVFGIRNVLEISRRDKIYRSDWASKDPNPNENLDSALGQYCIVEAYNGGCNNCHTQTGNHTNSATFPSDHTHNLDRLCTNCHDHGSGFRRGN